ncbi:MAG: hypothetical protein WBH75_01905 [Thermoanaerobaculia bacterium]
MNPWIRISTVLSVFVITVAGVPAWAQFTEEELAQRPTIETFLVNAEIVDSKQLGQAEGVTRPYKLTLREGSIQHDALWKNPSGRMGGFIEGWKYEIAAYNLDKFLGLNMVPPTAERRFHGNLGSINFWVDVWIDGRKKQEEKIAVPGPKLVNWNRMTYLQRAFDNLIGNEDRHLGNVLITEDWRMYLIDHSRSFRTTKAYTNKLQFDKKKPMKRLPRAFVEKIKGLDEATLRSVVGDTLTDKEIEAVMARQQLMLAEFDRLLSEEGEDAFLYD